LRARKHSAEAVGPLQPVAAVEAHAPAVDEREQSRLCSSPLPFGPEVLLANVCRIGEDANN
jgi:hypothetical protein